MRALQRIAFVFLLAWPPGRTASGQAAQEHRPSARATSRAALAEGVAAWGQIYSVLTHPRCINCHTATNYPQQGDDRHRHFANVVRGAEGKGVAALQCVSCHQQVNADTTGAPGASGWHLAPLSMRWQDGNDRILPSQRPCGQGIPTSTHRRVASTNCSCVSGGKVRGLPSIRRLG